MAEGRSAPLGTMHVTVHTVELDNQKSIMGETYCVVGGPRCVSCVPDLQHCWDADAW
jgi:hypothetical protein